MGRGKVQMKRIEDKSSRQVTFSKRRSGLMKKAQELSILCDVDIALTIFSAKGKVYEFCNGDSLSKIIERYQLHKDAVAGGSLHEPTKLPKGSTDLWRSTNLLQMVQRYLEEQNVEDLDITVQLEQQLETILSQTRTIKSQIMTKAVTALQEKEMGLTQEKQLTETEIPAALNAVAEHDNRRRELTAQVPEDAVDDRGPLASSTPTTVEC